MYIPKGKQPFGIPKRRNNTMTEKQLEKALYRIAAENILDVQDRKDLKKHRSDEEDFIETSVWGLEAALRAAYELGVKEGA